MEPVPIGVSHRDDALLALLSLSDELGRDPAIDPRFGDIDMQFLLTDRLVRGVSGGHGLGILASLAPEQCRGRSTRLSKLPTPGAISW